MKDKFFIFFKILGEYALYGLLFFIPISISLVEIFACLVLFGFVGRKIINPDFKFVRFWPNIFLLLFLFFSALSLINSGTYLNKSVHALFGKWFQYLGICVIIQDDIYDWKVIKRSMFVFLLSASLVVLSGISQYFFGIEFLRNKGIGITSGGMRAMTSSFPHYNGFGAYLVVVLSLVAGLALGSKVSRARLFILLIFSVFLTVSIMLTFSRGSWIALFASLVLMSVFAGKNFKWLIPIFFVVVAMLIFPEFYERAMLAFKAGGDSDRFKYWLVAFRMIREHPFIGRGLGTFIAYFPEYTPHSNLYHSYAHNCYFQIWAETGVFSLVSFTFFVFATIYIAIEKFLASKDFLLLGLLAGAAGFLVHSFFDTNLYSLQLAFLFWVWVGLIIVRLRMVSDG